MDLAPSPMKRFELVSRQEQRSSFVTQTMILSLFFWGLPVFWSTPGRAADLELDFNRDIRPILSNNCYLCHGPDEAERKGGTDGLRLDTLAGAIADLGGYQAIVPGNPEKSELLERVTTTDPDLMMPPPSSGKKLSPDEIQRLRRWIQEGGRYAPHWSYIKPSRPQLPAVSQTDWARNPIDRFILAKLEQSGHRPSPEAESSTLARRVCLDLTGLPPTPEELRTFLEDQQPGAYERLVDRLLGKQSYGEHWARLWLDLARYADSAGYADDPPRTIWLFRDYVIRSFNENKPFDQLTIEQLAGDLLPHPTPDQQIATAFHRNTLTNSEGGTDDEEFRNVAIIDRVNTTLSVWMGTTMACAQCHTHKFDPITQTEYFSVFAIFNNTADVDRKDEAPVYALYSQDQLEQKSKLEASLLAAEEPIRQPSSAILEELQQWDVNFPRDLQWTTLAPASAVARSGHASTITDNVIAVTGGAPQDSYTVRVNVPEGRFRALRLEALPDPSLPAQGPGHAKGNFILTSVTARLIPAVDQPVRGRYLRISIPGQNKLLSLAEVQVFQGDRNIAATGAASQISTDFGGQAERAIDGSTNGDYFAGNSVTHTASETDPWWELDLQTEQPLDRLQIWNRTDGGVGSRLAPFLVQVLDAARRPVWQTHIDAAPQPSLDLPLKGGTPIEFAAAVADYTQPGFSPTYVLKNPNPRRLGWAIGGETGKAHALTLLIPDGVELPAGGGTLEIQIEQNADLKNHTLGRFRFSQTDDPRARLWGETPQSVLTILETPSAQRTPEQQQTLQQHFLQQTPSLAAERKQVETLKKQLAGIVPVTVPVCVELPPDQQRVTHLQLRGNYLEHGDEVRPGTPAAFPDIPPGFSADRLGLAHWLVSEDNPLTSRVIANRYWEQIFGIGLVATSEDFGSQGELPSHPELLDWLAVELMQSGWDTKAFVKLLVTSAAYRQSSTVTSELYEEDPENRLLARGPRFRLSAEMIRDQSLALAGLLSDKMYGPPVRPPQPTTGLNAAFGGAVDWTTSTGEDKFRRGIYTSWRRSNPYPSMTTFDAPNREVCTVRRVRTNTPLQALVTLNDPVYIEAAQELARRILTEGGTSVQDRADYVLKLCLCRTPQPEETERLVQMYEQARTHFDKTPAAAKELATVPRGPAPGNMALPELAAWTVVANVVLNLDEVLMKR